MHFRCKINLQSTTLIFTIYLKHASLLSLVAFNENDENTISAVSRVSERSIGHRAMVILLLQAIRYQWSHLAEFNCGVI